MRRQPSTSRSWTTAGALLISLLTLVAISGCIAEDIEDIRDILFPGDGESSGRNPDLALSGLTIQPREPEPGQAITISVVVSNRGRRESQESAISLSVGEGEITSTQLPPISGGGTYELTFEDQVVLPAGLNVLRLLADPEDLITEVHEGDNALGATVLVGEPAYRRIFKWDYGGIDWELDLSLPATDIESLNPDRSLYSYDDYLEYVTPDDRTADAVAHILDFYSRSEDMGSYDEVSFLLAFVQEMPYTKDEDTKGDDYSRYPIETLNDRGGDCEDTSLLMASITSNPRHFNYGTALIIIDDHMAVGVTGSEGIGGVYFSPADRPDRRYYYCETTGKGYAIGEMPEIYDGADLKELIQCP